MIIYDKSSCNHCEKVFNFKNKLYNYIRSYECWKKEITRFVTTFIFVTKSIASYKFSLSTFVSVESIVLKATIITITPLSVYRFLSFLSSIYKLYKKLYFIIVNLYMRYTSLSKFIITRIIIMLLIMFM